LTAPLILSVFRAVRQDTYKSAVVEKQLCCIGLPPLGFGTPVLGDDVPTFRDNAIIPR